MNKKPNKRNPKLKNFLMSPSCLSEEDLEIYIAAEIEEMTKYFTQTLKKYQKGNVRLKSTTDSGDYEELSNAKLLEKLYSRKDGKFTTNEVNALKTKMDLYEMQYETFMKEIEKQPKGTFKIKDKVNLKKKLKDLESIYSSLVKTLQKKLQLSKNCVDKDEDTCIKVDTEIHAFFNLKDATIEVSPTTAAKINIVLEQINAVEVDTGILNVIKSEMDKFLQNLKCDLKSQVDPYNHIPNFSVSFKTVEETLSQIERYCILLLCVYTYLFNDCDYRDISCINYEYDNSVGTLLQRKQNLIENYEKLNKLNVYLNMLVYKLYEEQLEYRKAKQELQMEEEKAISNKNISKDHQSAMWSEIERKRFDLNNSFNSTFLSLQGQIKVKLSEMLSLTKIMFLLGD